MAFDKVKKSMNKWIKRIAVMVVLVVLAFIFYKGIYTPKTTFNTVYPVKGTLDIGVFGVGVVGAKTIYQVGAQTGGEIIELLTDQGQWVKKGALLVSIDPVELPLLLEEANIALKKAQLDVEALQKDLESMRAQAELAQLTEKRYSNLLKKGLISQAEFDQSKTERQALEAQMASIQSHLDAAQVETVRAKKNIETLETKLARFKVYSPIDGYVIEKRAEVAQTVVPSQVIFQIVSPDDVWIKAYIDERISGDIQVGQPAYIVLRSQPDKRFKGIVKRISAMSDSVTQEREVDVGFEQLPMPFYINEQAEVTIQVKHFENVLKVPVHLIHYIEKQPYLWIYQDGEAHLQAIEVTAFSNQEVAVTGVDERTRILVPDSHKKPLTEGMPVYIND